MEENNNNNYNHFPEFHNGIYIGGEDDDELEVDHENNVIELIEELDYLLDIE